jgi:hypothetical protein
MTRGSPATSLCAWLGVEGLLVMGLRRRAHQQSLELQHRRALGRGNEKCGAVSSRGS